MATTMVNPDLQRERDRASFDIEKLTHVLDGGDWFTERRRYIGMDSERFTVFLSTYAADDGAQVPGALLGASSPDLHLATRSRTRQNFEPVHIIGPVQNFGPPARNFGPLRAEFAWREWRKTLGGHVANWAGLSGFSPRENKISHIFFIDCFNEYSKVSNAHNPDDCHGVFNSGMLNKGWSFSRSRFDCLDLMHFFHG